MIVKSIAATSLLAACLSTSAYAAAPKATPRTAPSAVPRNPPTPKPPFEYKGFRAGEPVTAQQLATCRRTGPVVRLEEREAYLARLEQEAKTNKYDFGKSMRDGIREEVEKTRSAITPEQRAMDADQRECGENGSTISGRTIAVENISLYRGRLSSLIITFPAENFGVITDAFTVKYGKPCEASIKEVQNRMGAKFSSGHLAWCFANGKLSADMLGLDIETSTVLWDDPTNQPPKAAPKVDF